MEELGEPPFLNHTYMTAIDGLVMMLKSNNVKVKVDIDKLKIKFEIGLCFETSSRYCRYSFTRYNEASCINV